MISNFKELDFYMKADMMMNRGYFKKSFIRRIYELWVPDELIRYLRAMRKYSYYSNKTASLDHSHINFLFIPFLLYYKRKFVRLGYKLGFSIGPNSFGYGLVIHHHGTIVCGPHNKIGNYALINTSTCIVDRGSIIGDDLFMGTGAIISKKIELGNNIIIGANSVVNRSFMEEGILIAGAPATKVKEIDGSWYETLYGNKWIFRHEEVEKLKEKMNLSF